MSQQLNDLQLNTLLCFNTYALDRAFGRYYQAAFGDTGFTYPKFVILMALRDAGPLTVGELSSRIGVETNSISPVLKRMADFKVISRERSKEDERRVVLSIAPLGEELLNEASKVVEKTWATLGVDPDAVQQAAGLLNEVRQKIDAADPPKMTFRVPPPGKTS